MNEQEVKASLCSLFGCLRALHWFHWTNHWKVFGATFYGDHLLFERMYTSVIEDIDTFAEKLVGTYGSEIMGSYGHFDAAGVHLLQWDSSTDNLYQKALYAETRLQDQIRQTYEDAKSAGMLSFGMDDFLMALADSHETNIYLLRQRTRIASIAAPDMSAEAVFFDKPRAREVREFAESGAISNSKEIAVDSAKETGANQKKMLSQVGKAPLTTEEILNLPGSDQFSTLNRYVVETETPTDIGVPQGHDEVKKHPRLIAKKK